MRAAFVRAICELAEQDERILLLTGDLGFMALEPFAERFPRRFFNVGVAEQNMLGMATGLAEAGFVPFVYSIVTFATLRSMEFIRNGPVLHQLPVRIVGIGGGFEYAHAGPTHHGLEDIGALRSLPGLVLVAPADHLQAATAIRATWEMPGPVYYRLGKDDQTIVENLEGKFDIDEVEIVNEGSDLCILVMGSITNEALAAARLLEGRGVRVTVGVVSTLQPAPIRSLTSLLARFGTALTVEAHSINGGLGSVVSEVVAECGLPCRIVRCGTSLPYGGTSGSQTYLWQKHGLARTALMTRALQAMDHVRELRRAG